MRPRDSSVSSYLLTSNLLSLNTEEMTIKKPEVPNQKARIFGVTVNKINLFVQNLSNINLFAQNLSKNLSKIKVATFFYCTTHTVGTFRP